MQYYNNIIQSECKTGLICFSIIFQLPILSNWVKFVVTSDAGYFVPHIYFYCELCLYYKFFGKFNSANSSCQKLWNEILYVSVSQFFIGIFIEMLKSLVRNSVHLTLSLKIFRFLLYEYDHGQRITDTQ